MTGLSTGYFHCLLNESVTYTFTWVPQFAFSGRPLVPLIGFPYFAYQGVVHLSHMDASHFPCKRISHFLRNHRTFSPPCRETLPMGLRQ